MRRPRPIRVEEEHVPRFTGQAGAPRPIFYVASFSLHLAVLVTALAVERWTAAPPPESVPIAEVISEQELQELLEPEPEPEPEHEPEPVSDAEPEPEPEPPPEHER